MATNTKSETEHSKAGSRATPRPAPKAGGQRSKTSKTTRKDPRKAHTAPPITKLEILIQHLNGTNGASIVELSKATGWQAHSVRGALAGALKRKGHLVTSDIVDGVRRHRIDATK